ncbi:GNAT family N-acetyltransferase [Chengkuizengella sediminis]|uniref:GNAT family N-acetyltransferase n=1 Tax=Chengkuizengella sediminis TaxID=1885917 RepID=UPI0013899CD3|nr:GNAT family N-acetyltransferase [Chengkuizengella sediminis]NDI34478.1 GNAT family N-acetyltransferase [Chengkuizengella sediminis]
MITTKRLSDCSFQDAVTAWNKGFTGYYMDAQVTMDSFLNRFVSEGLSTELSILAYKDNEPIGLVLNGIREINGQRVAWNGGTGVAPELRSAGLGKLMMTEIFTIYKENGVDIATLEAIKQNEKAIKLYQKMGYDIKDQLLIYGSSESSQCNPLKGDFSEYEIVKVNPSEVQHVPFYNNRLPWQTQWQSVKSGEGLLVIDKSGKRIGYALYKQNYNQEGIHVSTILYQCEILEGRNDKQVIAAYLLSHCFSPFDQKCKRMIMNLSHTNQVVISLLNEAGFEKNIEQIYMEKTF